MAQLLEARDVHVPAYYRMFAVGEEPAGFGADTPLPGYYGLSFGDSWFWITVLDDLVDPALRIEHWDAEPPPVPPGYDIQETAEVAFPTGKIDAVQITRGPVSYNLDLPPGRYDARVTGWRDGSPERYLVQLWLRTPTAAWVHSAGCRIRAAHVGVVEYGSTEPVFEIRCDAPDPWFRMELWDGEPPEWTALPRVLVAPVRIAVRTGRFRMHPLRSGVVERHEFLPIGAAWVPPGGYRVRLTGSTDRFLAQLWPDPDSVVPPT